ncbi:hypothetical protein BDW22DRAFT_1487987 [Trametopsis cervina]|nr:hypothetical protein BDW22DRAFT_1487987 [Trametopsis cervina]
MSGKNTVNVETPTVPNVRRCTPCNKDVILSFGGERSWESHLPAKSRSIAGSKVHAASLLDTSKNAKEPFAVGSLCNSPRSSTDGRTHPRTLPVWLQTLQRLVLSLPLAVPVAEPTQTNPLIDLTRYALPTALSGPVDIDAAWEDINHALDNAVGYNRTPHDLQQFVMRGQYGMDAVYSWLSSCAEFLGSGYAGLLEPRVLKLCTALQLCGASVGPVGSPSPLRHISYLPDEAASDSDSDIVIVEHAPSASPPVLIHSSPLPLRTPRVQPSVACHGFLLPTPSNRTPYDVYPFALHTARALPWTLRISPTELRLFAMTCHCTTTTPSGLIERLRERTAELKHLKLRGLNITRSLASKTTAITDSKRILMAIATHPIPRIHVVLTVARKKGLGVNGLLRQLELARQSLYKPKSYVEEEFHQMALFSRLGGARVAYLAQQSCNLPSQRTTDRHLEVLPLRASPGYPTMQEMETNLSRQFRDDENYDEFAGFTEIAVSMPLDEIKIEERLRWDAKTNMILGTGREHGSERVALDFRSLAVADTVLDALIHSDPEEQVHLAKEATVIAVRVHAQGPRLNYARPFVVSETCKHEAVSKHKSLIRGALNALKQHQLPTTSLQLRVYTIDSDGDSKRRLAAASLTLAHRMSESSPLYEILHRLELFNLYCGEDDLVSNIDYDHIFKRLRNTGLRIKGITIDNIFLTPSIIRQHLLDSGLEVRKVDTLLAPNDKQNVPLAQGFLSAITALVEDGKNKPPAYRESRRALRALGFFFHHALVTYTDIRLTLGEQLEHLSALAHCGLALYSQFKGGFIPVQLYFDIMTMVKAAYFSVAKTQVANPHSKFWLILLGTDSLEKLFGIVRTMIGNDTNADQLQLASRLGSASLCSQLLQLHPEWDKGPNRLKLRPMEAGVVSRDYDHITPALWIGDLSVSKVVLWTSWKRGATIASEEMARCGIATTFTEMHQNGLDILCPFRAGSTVLLAGLTTGEREEDDDEIDVPVLAPEMPENTSDPQQMAPEQESINEELEPDLEDIASADPNTSLPDECTATHDAFVDIGSGKKRHKGTVLKIYSSALSVKNSKDRLKRVCGLSTFNNTSYMSMSSSPEDLDAPTTAIEDPIATLVRCNAQIWLALGIIVEIKVNNVRASSLPTAQLCEPNVRLRVQVMKLAVVKGMIEGDIVEPSSDVLEVEDNPDAEQWEWVGTYEVLSGQTSSRELDGRFVEAVNPSTAFSSQLGKGDEQTYRMSSTSLRTIATLLFERVRESDEANQLPTIKLSDTFPYRSLKGQACFLCKTEGESDISYQDQFRCARCPMLSLGTGPKLLEHMGAHILHDQVFLGAQDPCGLCLSISACCAVRLGKGTSGAEIVDLEQSRCPNLFKISLGAARKSTLNSPCSNAPMHCPLCPMPSNAVWRYNLASHLRQIHKANPDLYRDLWVIEDNEREAMLQKYNAVPRNQGKKKAKDTPSRALSVSTGHTSSIVIRDINPNSVPISFGDWDADEESSAHTIPEVSIRKRKHDSTDQQHAALGSAPEKEHELAAQHTTPIPLYETTAVAESCNQPDLLEHQNDTSMAEESKASPVQYPDESEVQLLSAQNHLQTDDSHNIDDMYYSPPLLQNSSNPPGKNDTAELDIAETFCSCGGDESGDMVECDKCDGWFHFECVGLAQAPSAERKWFCPGCASRKRKRRRRY